MAESEPSFYLQTHRKDSGMAYRETNVIHDTSSMIIIRLLIVEVIQMSTLLKVHSDIAEALDESFMAVLIVHL